MDEQVHGDIDGLGILRIRMNQNSNVILGNDDVDGKFASYEAKILFTHPLLSVIAGIVCIDDTPAN